MSELDKLEAYLKDKGIPYTREDKEERRDQQGYILSMPRHQIIVNDSEGRRLWDAICQRGSYGNEEGLLEVMGSPVVREEDGDSICGWLTAEDVIARLEEVANAHIHD